MAMGPHRSGVSPPRLDATTEEYFINPVEGQETFFSCSKRRSMQWSTSSDHIFVVIDIISLGLIRDHSSDTDSFNWKLFCVHACA